MIFLFLRGRSQSIPNAVGRLNESSSENGKGDPLVAYSPVGSGLHPFLRWPFLKEEVAEQGREVLHLVDYLSNGVGRKYGMRLTLLRSSGATKYERNNYLSSIRNFELMCPCERYTHQDYNGRKNELNYWGVIPLKG
jgi:hypothetical protein